MAVIVDSLPVSSWPHLCALDLRNMMGSDYAPSPLFLGGPVPRLFTLMCRGDQLRAIVDGGIISASLTSLRVYSMNKMEQISDLKAALLIASRLESLLLGWDFWQEGVFTVDTCVQLGFLPLLS